MNFSQFLVPPGPKPIQSHPNPWWFRRLVRCFAIMPADAWTAGLGCASSPARFGGRRGGADGISIQGDGGKMGWDLGSSSSWSAYQWFSVSSKQDWRPPHSLTWSAVSGDHRICGSLAQCQKACRIHWRFVLLFLLPKCIPSSHSAGR